MTDRPYIHVNSRGFWDLRNPPRNLSKPRGEWDIDVGWSYPLEWWHKAQAYVWALNQDRLHKKAG